MENSTSKMPNQYLLHHYKEQNNFKASVIKWIMLAIAVVCLLPKVVGMCKDVAAISIRTDNQTVTTVCHI